MNTLRRVVNSAWMRLHGNEVATNLVESVHKLERVVFLPPVVHINDGNGYRPFRNDSHIAQLPQHKFSPSEFYRLYRELEYELEVVDGGLRNTDVKEGEPFFLWLDALRFYYNDRDFIDAWDVRVNFGEKRITSEFHDIKFISDWDYRLIAKCESVNYDITMTGGTITSLARF